MKIGVIGSNGFVGKEIIKHLLMGGKNVIGINKDNYPNYLNRFFDILINANGNSKKYLANKLPVWDFEKSTLSVYSTIVDFRYSKYIYISSVDAIGDVVDLQTICDSEKFNKDNSCYGFNKFLSELIIQKYCPNYTILRCSSIIGGGMSKGVIYDIKNNNPLNITGKSYLQFITVNDLSLIIDKLLIDDGAFNCSIVPVGGIGGVIIESLGTFKYKKNATYQYYCMDVTKLQNKFKELKKSTEYVKEVL